ncbi:hypothetical protein C8D88_109341 [Lentzea atacamensis]|uniref:Uncharacterized protein n=1 Tax=Lentzea atacamensis TaxID=531938 RepID=A0A316HSE0_9PSEU|nr:hypothetical protein [Lentzea atacamensis]PWK84256.1 hypothetical protein C8D88_109341 [Lentzea atacamensis]RAS69124.1 hypothetical protein C8D87_1021202 [Lentzea atacamensis]
MGVTVERFDPAHASEAGLLAFHEVVSGSPRKAFQRDTSVVPARVDHSIGYETVSVMIAVSAPTAEVRA